MRNWTRICGGTKGNKLRTLISPSGDWVKARRWSDRGIMNGVALQNHADSAHDGTVDSSCPACVEIKSKMASATIGDA